jgi:hypothetical protein
LFLKSSASSSQDNFSNEPPRNIHATKLDIVSRPAPVVPPKSFRQQKSTAAGQMSQNSVTPTTQYEVLPSASYLEDKSHITDEPLKSVSTATNLTSTISKTCQVFSPHVQPAQEELLPTPKTVPNDGVQNPSLADALANTYQHMTAQVEDVSAAVTRDPVVRRNISTMFNEFNIILCGSPRVGKSTLINAICQQPLAQTSAGLGACTKMTSYYVLKGSCEIDSEIINYHYNFWDTP